VNTALDMTALDRLSQAESRAADLAKKYEGRDGLDLLGPIIRDELPGRIAVSSSFGAEAAVMLDLVAQVDPATPVIFLDTGKLFGETIRYRQTVTALLGLKDVRVVRPEEAEVQKRDPDGNLWMQNHDACCALRKVEPFARALKGFDAWITGRKRFHGGQRGGLPTIEAEDGRLKINPLATWSRERILTHFVERHLPPHPLVADGYLSIGCMPCTDRVKPDQGVRDGRWAGTDKDECGIHLPMSGGLGL
jgi:phosphoadenosine phosphosulfate reductase